MMSAMAQPAPARAARRERARARAAAMRPIMPTCPFRRRHRRHYRHLSPPSPLIATPSSFSICRPPEPAAIYAIIHLSPSRRTICHAWFITRRCRVTTPPCRHSISYFTMKEQRDALPSHMMLRYYASFPPDTIATSRHCCPLFIYARRCSHTRHFRHAIIHATRCHDATPPPLLRHGPPLLSRRDARYTGRREARAEASAATASRGGSEQRRRCSAPRGGWSRRRRRDARGISRGAIECLLAPAARFSVYAAEAMPRAEQPFTRASFMRMLAMRRDARAYASADAYAPLPPL